MLAGVSMLDSLSSSSATTLSLSRHDRPDLNAKQCLCRQLRTLAAGADEGVEGDDVGLAAVAVHLLQQLQGQLPAPGLLAGADEAAVGDHVALAAALHHVLEDPQRLLYLQGRRKIEHTCTRQRQQS